MSWVMPDNRPAPGAYVSPPGQSWPLAAAPIFWINRESRTDRRAHMDRQLADWPGVTERIVAVDLTDIPSEDIAGYVARFGRSALNRRIPSAEIAAVRSHRLALKAAIARGWFPALVFEDDVDLTSGWWAGPLPDGWQVVVLGGWVPAPHLPPEMVDGWGRLSGQTWNGAWAYAVADARSAAYLDEHFSRELAPPDGAWRRVADQLAVFASDYDRVGHEVSISSDLQVGGRTPGHPRPKPEHP